MRCWDVAGIMPIQTPPVMVSAWFNRRSNVARVVITNLAAPKKSTMAVTSQIARSLQTGEAKNFLRPVMTFAHSLHWALARILVNSLLRAVAWLPSLRMVFYRRQRTGARKLKFGVSKRSSFASSQIHVVLNGGRLCD